MALYHLLLLLLLPLYPLIVCSALLGVCEQHSLISIYVLSLIECKCTQLRTCHMTNHHVVYAWELQAKQREASKRTRFVFWTGLSLIDEALSKLKANSTIKIIPTTLQRRALFLTKTKQN